MPKFRSHFLGRLALAPQEIGPLPVARAPCIVTVLQHSAGVLRKKISSISIVELKSYWTCMRKPEMAFLYEIGAFNPF